MKQAAVRPQPLARGRSVPETSAVTGPVRATPPAGLNRLRRTLSPWRVAGGSPRDQCGHKACARNPARWMKQAAVRPQPLARGRTVPETSAVTGPVRATPPAGLNWLR